MDKGILRPSYAASLRRWRRWTALSLGVALLQGTSPALGSCIRQLKGMVYTNLPTNLCSGYSDLLLGRSHQAEYSGVICDRPEASYILLQRLLRYDADGKAVWKILRIKTIQKPNDQSLVLGAGCQQQASTDPIFALVQTTPLQSFQTLLAWKVNLDKASFIALNPKDVHCKTPLLSGLEN